MFLRGCDEDLMKRFHSYRRLLVSLMSIFEDTFSFLSESEGQLTSMPTYPIILCRSEGIKELYHLIQMNTTDYWDAGHMTSVRCLYEAKASMNLLPLAVNAACLSLASHDGQTARQSDSSASCGGVRRSASLDQL